MDATRPLDLAGGDPTPLPDQLILDCWYLPPEGDQSWRDRDARRIFGGDGKSEINETGTQPVPAAVETGCEEPAFETPATVPILLPFAVATAAMVFVTAVSAPGILTARFWSSPEPRLSPTPVIARASDAALPGQSSAARSLPDMLRPSVTEAEPARLAPEPVHMADVAVNAQTGQTAAEALAPATDPRPAAVQTRNRTGRTARLAAVKTAPSDPPSGRSATAGPPAVADVPISTAPPSDAGPTAPDWKAQAAQWDKLANDIRARSGKCAPSSAADPAPSYTDAPTAADWRAQAAQWDQLANTIRARSEKNRAGPAVP